MTENINLIIDQFGGKKDVLIVLQLMVVFFILTSWMLNKYFRFAAAIFFSVLVVFQIISLYFTQSFVGYEFFVHLNIRDIKGLFFLYSTQLIGLILFLFCLVIVLFNSRKFINKIIKFILPCKGMNSYWIAFSKVIVLAISSFLIITVGNFVSDSKTLQSLFVEENSSEFKEILAKNGITNYTLPNEIQANPGKNIVVISIESLEKAFLEKGYSELTPNLNRLKKEWGLIELNQNLGSNWTSGSIYTSLTGFPAFFGIERNNIFQKAHFSQISSVSHALKAANYQTVFMNGNADYAGLKEMLFTLKFDKVLDMRNLESTGYESQYGLRDKDLMNFAKIEVNNLKKNGKPFALFISTTDTHFPNGLYDSRMEEFISKKNSDLEFMIASIDYLIGDFIKFLKENNLLSNTAVFIYPDHLKMGDPSMFKNAGNRGLYIITNVDNTKQKLNNDSLYQIDLPKIILQGGEVKHNLNFLTDYIDEDKKEFIESNIRLITEINTNGISRLGEEGFIKEDVSANFHTNSLDTMRFIAHAGGQIDNLTYTNSKEALDLSYSKGFRLFELDINKTSDGKFVAVHDWYHWAKITNQNFKGPVTHEEFLNRKIYGVYTPMDMDAINCWFEQHQDAILVTDKVNTPKSFTREFIAPDRLMMELFDLNAVKEALDLNIKSAMPSYSVIQNMGRTEIESLRKIGVKNVAISRNVISQNKLLLKHLKQNNIKPYAFHINQVEGVDEEYMVKYEMDDFYGIYADDWEFEEVLNEN